MPSILVSACLLGQRVRYDGGTGPDCAAILAVRLPEFRVISICPEVAGGLPTPRAPAEIQAGKSAANVLHGQAKIATVNGGDVTAEFIAGAKAALDLARREGCDFALLKEASPSCGANLVHTGNFDGATHAGTGLTAEMLKRAGLHVFSEHQIDALVAKAQGLQRG